MEIYLQKEYLNNMAYHRALFWGHFYSIFSLTTNPYYFYMLSTKVICHTFADANSIHSRVTYVGLVQCCLKEDLTDVSKWCDQIRVIPYPGKTNCTILASKQKHQLKPLMLNLAFGTNIIEQVREHRFLGVTIVG